MTRHAVALLSLVALTAACKDAPAEDASRLRRAEDAVPARTALDDHDTPRHAAPAEDPPAAGGTVKPGADAGTDAEKAEPKVERRSTKEADEAVKRYAALLKLPTSGAKSFEAKLSTVLKQIGNAKVTASPTWTQDKGLQLNLVLDPEFLKRMGIPVEQAAFWTNMLEGQFAMNFASLFESMEATLPRYHSQHKETEEGLRVELIPVGPKGIAWERQKCWFGEDGLMRRMVGIRHYPNPADPSIAHLVGTEEDFTFEYADHGGAKVLSKVSIATEMTSGWVQFEYYDVEGHPALPKSAKIQTPMSPQPVDVAITDIVLDGKPIDATKSKDTTPGETPGGAVTPEGDGASGDPKPDDPAPGGSDK